MKKFFLYILPFCVAWLAGCWLTSCGDDDNNSSTENTVPLKADPTSLAFGKDGGTKSLVVTSGSAVTVQTDANWLIAVQKSNNQNNYFYDVTAEQHDGNTERTATLTFLAGNEKAIVTVSQSNADGQTIAVSADGSTFEVKGIGNGAAAVCDAMWIIQNDGQFTAEPNKTDAERTGLIILKYSNGPDTVYVTQAAGKFPATSLSSTAMEIAEQMYPAWNLGNTMEATYGDGVGCETGWQPTKTSQKIIDFVKASGFRAVRIPCSWYIHSDADNNYKIDAKWIARVKEIVDYCINDGLYVELNDHWDSGWIEVLGFSSSDKSYTSIVGNDEYINGKIEILKNLWTQIATEFKDYDQHLIFAGLNEPFQEYNLFHDKHQTLSPILAKYNQAFVDAVRATGGNNAQRVLAVQGPSTNASSTVQYMTMPTDIADQKLMVEVHYYDPYNFTINSGDGYTPLWNDENSVKQTFSQLKAKFSDHGVPVIIGEYAANWREVANQDKHNASVKAFYKAVSKWGPANGLIPFAWDTNHCPSSRGTGGTGAIINRAKCEIYGTHSYSGIVEGTDATVWMK
jgi:endoglucanase